MRFAILILSNLAPAIVTADEDPNVIVFLTDDQGWGDLGYYGHPRIKSPNLDQFAAEGLAFRQLSDPITGPAKISWIGSCAKGTEPEFSELKIQN